MPAGKIENPVNADGEAIDLTAPRQNDNRGFELIPQGMYQGVILSFKGDTEGRMGNKNVPNPNSKDGKWRVERVTPEIRLLNDNRTYFGRENRIVYYLTEEGTPARPEADGHDPLWGGDLGAQNLFLAAGLIRKTGNNIFEYNFQNEDIKDRVILVNVKHSGYVKSIKKNLKPAELQELLVNLNGGNFTFDQLPELVKQYNEGVELSAEDGLRVQNTLGGFWALNQKQAEEAGFYFDTNTNATFLTEASYHAFENAKVDGSGATPW